MVSINTNVSSIIAQRGLINSTTALDTLMKRMSSGYKLNSASDNAANYAIAQAMSSKISSLSVAEENANLGLDMVQSMSAILELISKQTTRLRDLAEQAANGTYGTVSIDAMNQEAQSIIDEIIRLTKDNDFGEISLFREAEPTEEGEELPEPANMITFQIGIGSGDDSKISFNAYFSVADILDVANMGINNTDVLDIIDGFMEKLLNRQTEYGSVSNRLTSVLDSISVKYNNLVSSRSTLRDADAGELSSEYVKQQILQQAAATLLSTANQSPAIALQLI